jgi:hypothetical protein
MHTEGSTPPMMETRGRRTQLLRRKRKEGHDLRLALEKMWRPYLKTN